MSEPHAQTLCVFKFHTIQWVQRKMYVEAFCLKKLPEPSCLASRKPCSIQAELPPSESTLYKVPIIDEKYPVWLPFFCGTIIFQQKI